MDTKAAVRSLAALAQDSRLEVFRLLVQAGPAGLAAAAACGLRTLGVAQTYPAEELGRADAVVSRLDGFRLSDLLARFPDS